MASWCNGNGGRCVEGAYKRIVKPNRRYVRGVCGIGWSQTSNLGREAHWALTGWELVGPDGIDGVLRTKEAIWEQLVAIAAGWA